MTVVIPAYNAEPFLGTAVRSALNQTLGNIEVIVVDDASTDGTLDVARRLADLDRRVHVVEHQTRCGPAGGRNSALALARSRWIALLDADDFFEPDRLEVLIDEAERRQCDFIADNLRLRNADGVWEGLAFDVQGMSRTEPLRLIDLVTLDASPGLGARALGFCKPIIRRDFICEHGLKYDVRAFVGQDFIFYFSAISRGARFCLTPASLYNFTVGHASHSTGERALMEITEANARLLKEEPRIDPIVRAALRRREAQLRFDIFRTHVHNRAPVEALLALARVQPKLVYERFAVALRRKARRALVTLLRSPKDAKT